MRETHTNNTYKPGDWYRECDICGFDYYRSELIRNSDGLLVCRADYEPKHPRLFKSNLKERTFKGD